MPGACAQVCWEPLSQPELLGLFTARFLPAPPRKPRRAPPHTSPALSPPWKRRPVQRQASGGVEGTPPTAPPGPFPMAEKGPQPPWSRETAEAARQLALPRGREPSAFAFPVTILRIPSRAPVSPSWGLNSHRPCGLGPHHLGGLFPVMTTVRDLATWSSVLA